MTLSSRLALGILSIVVPFLAGCGDDTPPIAPASYYGTWRHLDTLKGDADDTVHISTLQLARTTNSTWSDTTMLLSSGTILSTSTTTISFTDVLDGYQRGLEITGADSIIRYWYFFKTGSKLMFYRGMRFRGNNIGLQGAWAIDSSDLRLAHPGLDLTFRGDSVALLNNDTIGPSNGIYPYSSSNRTLLVNGGPLPYGSRYEVIPGYLYITSPADREFSPVQ